MGKMIYKTHAELGIVKDKVLVSDQLQTFLEDIEDIVKMAWAEGVSDHNAYGMSAVYENTVAKGKIEGLFKRNKL